MSAPSGPIQCHCGTWLYTAIGAELHQCPDPPFCPASSGGRLCSLPAGHDGHHMAYGVKPHNPPTSLAIYTWAEPEEAA